MSGSNSFLGSCSTDAWRHSSIHCWRSCISLSSKKHSPSLEYLVARTLPFLIFLQLALWGEVRSRSFWQRRRENLRYTELCTFGFISLEHRTQGKPRFEVGNPKWYGFDVHNRIRLWCAEAVRPRRGRRVRSLWRLRLLLVRKGMLRPDAMRVLLRLSCNSFMPEGFSANGTPTRSSRVSPGASPLCCVATSSTGWHAPKRGARPLSWHFVARCLNASVTRNQNPLGGVRTDRRMQA